MIKPEDILTLRKWDSVLFTTYALSISFFESYVLHHLRRKGFDEIWVIADAEGYQNSMMERRAWGAGRDYHLIPVRVPGVFHCKCAYFSSSLKGVCQARPTCKPITLLPLKLRVGPAIQPEIAPV